MAGNPHTLTPFNSERAKIAAAKSAEVRRAKAKKFREQMQDELLAASGTVVTKRLLSEEDWRAWIAAVEQAFGKAKESSEVEHSGEVRLVMEDAFASDEPGSELCDT